MAYEQAGQICRLLHGLDNVELHIQQLRGTESISQLFEFELELISPSEELDFTQIVGQTMTVTTELGNGEVRNLTGIVSRFSQSEYIDEGVGYRMLLVPWLWLLTRRRDCRIFQNQTVPDIVRAVFSSLNLNDFEMRLVGTYEPMVNCVQYRETDYQFVARLLEEEGIHYFFEHQPGKSIMVIADAPNHNLPCPNMETAEYDVTPRDPGQADRVTTWQVEQLLQPALYSATDFNFRDPATSLQVSAPSTRTAGAGESLEIFDFPGGYVNLGAEADPKLEKGESRIRLRAEEGDAQVLTARAETDCRAFLPGYRFDLAKHFRDSYNITWLIREVRHEVDQAGIMSSGSPETVSYRNRIICQPHEIPFRPPRTTQKPRIDGPQTAIVAGKQGEEVFIDEFGRIKVQFTWDRYGAYDENSSCWIRVAQQWAGKNWGFSFHPRIGQEVVVNFLEGDPDQPLVTGSVYNAEQPLPYETPSQTGIKSRSTKEGSPNNFNEIRFEDMKGSEEFYLQAEKALRMHVKDGATKTVGSSISTNAGGSISSGAGANISRTADDDIKDSAGKGITVESGKDMKLKSGGSYQLMTNMGIQLKAMNFVGALIESGAKKAAEAIKKGGMATAATAVAAGAQGAATGGAAAGAAGSAAADGAADAGNAALSALSPGIEAGAAELTALSNQAVEGTENLEGPVTDTIEAADKLNQAIEAGATPESIAAAFMSMAAAAAKAFADAQKIVEGLLPQIPSITLWAMKDINAMAVWSMELKAGIKDIKIEAEKRHVEIKADQELKIEAKKKDLSIKASAKKINVTAKDQVKIKSEDENIVIEASKKKVMIESPEQIFLKCGKATISMAKSGNIVIKGAKINVKGSNAITIKGKEVKMN